MEWDIAVNLRVTASFLGVSFGMKPDFRKCMIWLHTYSGLILGWLLYAIFVSGTLSYFNPEISQWMKPELNRGSHSSELVNQSIEYLQTHASDAERWRIYMPNERTQHWKVQWNTGRERHSQTLNIQDGSMIEVRDTKGGDFFRTFHYTLQLRGYGGRYIAGAAAMLMLVAVFSGIFTHRRFFRDFFTLRWNKFSKLLTDSHAIAGVITLPFCIMICTSALMIYITMYIPWGAEHYYKGGQRELNKYTIPALPKLDKNSEIAKKQIDFSVLQQKINQVWLGSDQIDTITIERPNREIGRIIVSRVKQQTLSNQAERLVFSSVTGQALPGYPNNSAVVNVRRVFYGLHEAQFAGTAMRWMFFILGAAASALIASGLFIWLNKRLNKTKKQHLGHLIVGRLNLTGILGLLLAILAYFQANRWLPIDIENRASVEIEVFFWAWLATLVHSLLRPIDKAWLEQLLAGAMLCFSLPIIDFSQDPSRLLGSFGQTNMIYLTFNVVIIVVGFIFLNIALKVRHRTNSVSGNALC